MNNIADPALIQTFIAKATVKALKKSVLRQLARLNKPKIHTLFKKPLVKCTAGKLGP